MNIHIEVGSWIFPTLVTFVVAVWWVWDDATSSRGYYGYDIAGIFNGLLSIIVCLGSWLIWALFK